MTKNRWSGAVSAQMIRYVLRRHLQQALANINPAIVGDTFHKLRRELEVSLDYLNGTRICDIARRHDVSRDAVNCIAAKYRCPPRKARRVPVAFVEPSQAPVQP